MQKHVFSALSPASKFRVVRKETRMSPEITPEITRRNGVGRPLIITHFFRETFTRRFSGDGLQLLFCLNREKISLFFIFL